MEYWKVEGEYNKLNNKLISEKREAKAKIRRQKKEAKAKIRRQEKAKIKQQRREAGCYNQINRNIDKGTIGGYVKSILDYGFMFSGGYYVKTSNASAKSILTNKRYMKLIVKRTGKTRRFSLHELYPYHTKKGESEYSAAAVRHGRRYPSTKFRTLKEVTLVGLWDSLCK